MKESIVEAKKLMEKCGFPDMKYMLTEWHYDVVDWETLKDFIKNGFGTSESAAFSASCMIELMDMDFVETAYYYSWTGSFGLFNIHSAKDELMPVYYALLFFQKLAADCRYRIPVKVESDLSVKVLSGKTDDGKIRILVSLHDCDDCVVNIDCGANKALLKCVNAQFDKTDCTRGKEISSENGVFTINHTDRHSVYLFEICS